MQVPDMTKGVNFYSVLQKIVMDPRAVNPRIRAPSDSGEPGCPSLRPPVCLFLCQKKRKDEFILAHILRKHGPQDKNADRQDHEAAGHTASTVGKQRELLTGAQIAFFLLFGPQFVSASDPHLRWVFPPPFT